MKNIFLFLNGKTMTRIVEEYASYINYTVVPNIEECDIVIYSESFFEQVRDQYKDIIGEKKWLSLTNDINKEKIMAQGIFFNHFGNIFNYLEVPFYKEELERKLNQWSE